MNPEKLTAFIRKEAVNLKFDLLKIAPAKKLERSSFLEKWLQTKQHGTMQWMESNLEKRMDVKKLFPDAKSVVVIAVNYYSPEKHDDDPEKAKISRYAWGKDYHKILKKKLKQLLLEIKKLDSKIDGRICVDTAPMQDKLWAVEAGIGWQGKNTNILTREMGSWIFLGELILNSELVYDSPVEDYCGSCTACIEACPTDALKPYVLDARKCISYLTIEFWDQPIPNEFKKKLENWVFGCDICQDVCPWNKFSKLTQYEEFKPHPENVNPSLSELNQLDEETFNKRFKSSPLKRAKFVNFKRNVKTLIKASESKNIDKGKR